MYAHVTTHHLGTYAATIAERDTTTAMSAHPGEHVISDQAARTISSWYHSPNEGSQAITALSHGIAFDTTTLLAEIDAEIEPIDTNDASALRHWALALEERLSVDLQRSWCDCGPFGHRRGCRNG